MTKTKKREASNKLTTIIRKLERWQNRYMELDEENASGHAKTKLIHIWHDIEGDLV